MTSVWLTHLESYPRHHRYRVNANGKFLDEFISTKKLRRDDLKDIASLYRTSLDGDLQP